MIHQETRRNAAGATLYKKEAEVQYAIGSGRQAFSYLIERDGFLFESPITWYAHDRRWGLSPGYETRVSRFDRPVLSECLFCHANRAERVSSANNRYRTPVFFQGHAIGCERCHGPGELHVRQADGGRSARDVTIVNPANLAPSRRDAVCEQCHLIGPQTHCPDRHPKRRLSARSRVLSVLVDVRAVIDLRNQQVRQPGRADARQPLLSRERRPARVHLVP